MEPYQDERYNFILWPVVAYVLNSAGQANYVNGITPDFTLSERNLISPLYTGRHQRVFIEEHYSLYYDRKYARPATNRRTSIKRKNYL